MPRRKRAQEAQRAARPRDLRAWEVEPVGVVVQTEEAWPIYDEIHAPDED